ncbi:MAG TPA: xanthine dehydrogenase family protein subunit M [Chloroflexota bacterium]|nr:xanthine dehydrogenase family protein subunit M [Chloroflexota bacterium]
MKPAKFAYHAPRSVDQAVRLLAELGDEAKVLAGGQSLVPLMNFRLARPAHLVDLNRIEDLRVTRVDGELRIGAMTRQRQVERARDVGARWPLLTEALGLVGHVQIRNRGTIGGSLAHADPAAELPAVMMALDAEFTVRSATGTRAVAATDFFLGPFTTQLEPTELLTEIHVPDVPPRTGMAFQEVSRRHGDFAIVGVAALVTLEEQGPIDRARLVFCGAADRPIRSARAEQALLGRAPDERLLREASELATEDLDPADDVHASAGYRRRVASVIARRALLQAAQRARET